MQLQIGELHQHSVEVVSELIIITIIMRVKKNEFSCCRVRSLLALFSEN